MTKMSQLKRVTICLSVNCYLLLIFARYAFCSIAILPGDLHNVPTEPPERVEIFNPQEWISIGASSQKIQISSLKLETKVKLRYGRTRISMSLKNPHDKPLQANFRIILPDDAFFTIFRLKRDKSAKFYAANVTRKHKARDLYRFAHSMTNGTVSAGFIELSNDQDLSSYNLKFSLGPGIHIQTYLVYERQMERREDLYRDTIYIYPLENSVIRMFHTNVEVEEVENITALRCSPSTENTYTNCSQGLKRNKRWNRKAELDWRHLNVTTAFLRENPFEFQYELEKQNTTSAVVITQSNGNLYFVHLFVPQNLPVIRKHIAFLLDISDSMHGKKLDQLKWSMTEILDDLSPDDFFTIIPFSVEATVWSPFKGDRRKCPLPLPAAIDRFRSGAIDYVRSITPHGVTNIYTGLMQAFDVIQLFSPHSLDMCDKSQNINTPNSIRAKLPPKLPENVESMIFFLSDGIATTGPTDPNYLLELFTTLNHRNLTKPIQIHTIAYGEAADSTFLKALSSRNGGTMKRIIDESAAGIELTNFYTEISSQVLSEIQTFASLSANGTEDEFSQRQTISANLVLVKGGEVLTAGRLFPDMNQTELLDQPMSNFHWSTEASSKIGHLKYNSEIYDCRTLSQCAERLDFYLLRLQAYQLLKKLLDRDHLVQQGYICPKSFEDDVVYSDNLINYDSYYYDDKMDVPEDCVNPYKEKIIDLALKEQFVTPYTAFILSTAFHVDTGLLGSGVDSGGSDSPPPPPPPESEEIPTINIPQYNVSIPTDTQSVFVIEEPLPPGDKTIRMNRRHYEVNETIPNVTEIDEGPDLQNNNKTFLSKTIRDFVASFVKILGDKPNGEPDLTVIDELAVG